MNPTFEPIVNGESMKSIQDFVNMNVHMLYMYRFNKLETRACIGAIKYINKHSKFLLKSEFMGVISEINDSLIHSPAGYRYDLTVLEHYYNRYNVLNSRRVKYYVK